MDGRSGPVKALAIFQRLGDRPRTARSLGNLGNVALQLGDPATARTHYEQALTIARAVGDRRGVATGLHCLGLLASDSDDPLAAQWYLEEGIAIAREMGDWSPAAMLSLLGSVKRDRGDLSAARRVLIEAVDAERAFGNKVGIARTLPLLAGVLHEMGDTGTAKAHLIEALTIQQATNERLSAFNMLEAFACLALEIAGPNLAARLFGQVDRIQETTGRAVLRPSDRLRLERYVTAARAAMQDDAAFDRAWEEGRAMSLADAVRCMLEA